jgi:serine/threonine protein kinase/Flp pilus assembly protein TadD
MAVTPPPLSDLDFSCSIWSASGEDDVPRARRNPRIGDTLFGFKLVGELGRGAFARVFLAHQEALASRPVALKVTLRPTREAERLARLQHTNIVPVYSVHDEGSVQVICMPFLGRTTLADLIRAYRSDIGPRHSGRKSTSARAARTTMALDSKNPASKSTDSNGTVGPARQPVWTWAAEEPPPIVGDPNAVLQLLSQLADGLGHAHERGILHLDLKPANVLLADTGEPMLLDFNLSFDATQPDRDLVGGTMPYMAIEQLLDMRDRGKGVIDARTDLYALGVMAYELLSGAVPFASTVRDCRDIAGQVAARRAGPPPLRPRNPYVTPAVEALLMKLLAPEPADRYQNAYQLKHDIDRHLNDLPLQFARDKSLRERWGKWRRRNPRTPYRILVGFVVAVAVGTGALAARSAEANARYQAVERAKEARSAIDMLRLDLVLPEDTAARERGTKRALELVAAYGLPGSADWQKRPDVRRLAETERAALAGDLGELMILLARLKLQEAEVGDQPARRARASEAWELLEASRTCYAAGAAPAALDRLAALVAPVAGVQFDAPAEGDREPDSRGLFLDAALAINKGRYEASTPLLERVLLSRPDHTAAQFCLAYCRQHRGQYQRALERYDVARTRLPADPRPAFQRGMIYGLLKCPEKAEIEFTTAIGLDPNHVASYCNRALARFRIGTRDKLAAAELDLNDALDRGARPLFVHFMREHVRSARGDRAGAAADAAISTGLEVTTEEDYLVRGWTRISSDLKGARADFQRAAELNPRSLIALQNMAHVLAEKLNDNRAALEVSTRVAELYPEYGIAVASRAVLLARLGRREEAHEQIEKARAVSDDPEVTYQAALVYSLTSATHPEDREKALALLRLAIREGYRAIETLAVSPDLDPIRKSLEFLDIQSFVSGLAPAQR